MSEKLKLFTCRHLGFDTDTGEWSCKIPGSNPSRMEWESLAIQDDSVDGKKQVPVCNVFNWIGARMGKGAIAALCDKSEEVGAVDRVK